MSVYFVCAPCKDALQTMVMGMKAIELGFVAACCSICFANDSPPSPDEKEWPRVTVDNGEICRVLNRATWSVWFLGALENAVALVAAYDDGEF